jgi:hypothetical protein
MDLNHSAGAPDHSGSNSLPTLRLSCSFVPDSYYVAMLISLYFIHFSIYLRWPWKPNSNNRAINYFNQSLEREILPSSGGRAASYHLTYGFYFTYPFNPIPDCPLHCNYHRFKCSSNYYLGDQKIPIAYSSPGRIKVDLH